MLHSTYTKLTFLVSVLESLLDIDIQWLLCVLRKTVKEETNFHNKMDKDLPAMQYKQLTSTKNYAVYYMHVNTKNLQEIC